MDERKEQDVGTGVVRDRRRFYAALALFLLWVAGLGAMAFLSGRRPSPSPSAIENR